MNRARRKAIANLVVRLDIFKRLADEIRSDLETIKDAEREAFENLSGGLQEVDRGQAMVAAADALEEAEGAMDEIVDTIHQVVEHLITASA